MINRKRRINHYKSKRRKDLLVYKKRVKSDLKYYIIYNTYISERLETLLNTINFILKIRRDTNKMKKELRKYHKY